MPQHITFTHVKAIKKADVHIVHHTIKHIRAEYSTEAGIMETSFPNISLIKERIGKRVLCRIQVYVSQAFKWKIMAGVHPDAFPEQLFRQQLVAGFLIHDTGIYVSALE